MSWFFADVPFERLVRVRRIVFGYGLAWLVTRAIYVVDVAGLPDRRFEGVGVWAWLGDPLPELAVALVLTIAIAACALVVADRVVRLSSVTGATATLAVVTYTNSWGQVFHTENLLVLHLAILAFAALAPGSDPSRARPGWTSGWPLKLMSVVVVTSYVLAGVAKLRIGGWDWVSGDVLANQVAFDNLRKILLGDVHSPIGGWIVGVDGVWAPIAIATLVIELGAPFALLGGRARNVWVAAAWSFHLGILALMAILFPYQLTGVAFVSMFAVERIGLRRRSSSPSRAPAPSTP